MLQKNLKKNKENMDNLHYLLMKADSMLKRNISTRATEEGLSSGQPKVLEFLLENEGSDQKTIAANCEIEQATVGTILNKMEKDGLIERRQAVGNRRSLFVYMTSKGWYAAEKMSVIFQEEDKKASNALTEQELEMLLELLKKVCLSMKE